MNEVTRILEAAQRGDALAADQLLPLVYDELRRIAAYKMSRETPGQTLQPTALVHEAWMRLVGTPEQKFDGRGHFFAAAGEAMRRILVDAARRRRSLKRGGGVEREEWHESKVIRSGPSDEVLAIDEALNQLALEDPVSAELVKLRYFVGMTMDEAAEALGLSLRSAERLWTFSRAWLRRRMNQTAA